MRILFATDGSDDARNAVRWMSVLSFGVPSDVLVVTVVNRPIVPSIPDTLSDVRRALLADAQALVDATSAELAPRWHHVDGRVLEGDPREAIVELASGWHADLVVMGARGLGAVKEFLLGSVSLSVAAHAPCPVLVCKGDPRALRTITVAVDGSQHARDAVAWLAAGPLAAGASVRVIGVVEPVRYPSTAPGMISRLLREAVGSAVAERRTELEGVTAAAAATLGVVASGVHTAVVVGAPAEAVVRDAEAHGSELVVVGARGLGAVRRLLLGSVSESVLRHAGCSVLVVRPRPT